MLYLEKKVFELISPMIYYLQVVSRDAASAIGCAIFRERCRIGYRFRLPTFWIIEWSAWLSNIKRGS